MRVSRWVPYFCVLPSLLVLIGIMYPFGLGVYQSLTDLDLTTASAPSFVGLANYLSVLKGVFWPRCAVTLAYTALALVFQLLLGLLIANLVNQERRGMWLIRSVVIIPLMIPPLISAMMWKTMMDPVIGVLNYLLQSVGVRGIQWLADIRTALISAVLIDTWIFTPFVALILLAGLQTLPEEPMEAARVDGAGPLQVFRWVKLPLLKPFIVLTLLFRVIDLLKTFDTVWATTQGGPGTSTTGIVIGAYRDGFTFGKMGVAMTYVVLLFIGIMCLAQVLLRQLERGDAA